MMEGKEQNLPLLNSFSRAWSVSSWTLLKLLAGGQGSSLMMKAEAVGLVVTPLVVISPPTQKMCSTPSRLNRWQAGLARLRGHFAPFLVGVTCNVKG